MIRNNHEENYRRLKEWYASIPPLIPPKKSWPTKIEVLIFGIIVGAIFGYWWCFKAGG